MKVLYVEDDPFDADLTRRSLLKHAPSIHLDIARSRAEALKRLEGGAYSGSAPPQQAEYDLLLTDLNLPDGSGFALLSHIREHRTPLAVVVITGQGDEEVAVSALKAGADDYVVKREGYLDRLPGILSGALERYKLEAARRQNLLRVLYLEGDAGDGELVRRHFSSHAPHIRLEIVLHMEDVIRRLPGGPGQLQTHYDVLLLDCRQSDLQTLELLREVQQVRRLDLPVIFAAARGSEDAATQALRLGASDYIVKDPAYLLRLPALLENAHHRARLLREQGALRASEERYRRLADNAPDVIYRLQLGRRPFIEYLSPAIEKFTGYLPEELYRQGIRAFRRLIPLSDYRRLRAAIARGQHPGPALEFRLKHKDGRLIWIEAHHTPVFDPAKRLIANEGIGRDITERKKAEESLERQLKRLHALRLIDTAISTGSDLRITLDVLLDHVVSELGVDAADILLLEPASQILTYRAGIGFRSRQIENLRLDIQEAYPGSQAALQGQISDLQIIDLQINPFPAHPISELPGGLLAALAGEGFVVAYAAPLIVQNQLKGVLQVYHRSLLQADVEWVNFLETLAGQAAIAIDNAGLLDGLQTANQELTQAYDRTLEGWVRALDLRDQETQWHTQRVTNLTLRLAKKMGVAEEQLIHIRRGALLHDIGKIGIPDRILHKPGPLSEEEWALMRKHPLYAYELLAPIEYLRQAIDIPYCHHERWDGTGYPQGLAGEQIPLAARVFAVVDVWDALSSDRPYRPAWDAPRVKEYILSLSGAYFDPAVVDAFLELTGQSISDEQ